MNISRFQGGDEYTLGGTMCSRTGIFVIHNMEAINSGLPFKDT